MHELLSKIEPEHLIGLVSVIGAFACGIVGIVMGVGLAMRRVELAAGLKRDMLDRGMTAEEILIVMEAGSKDVHHHRKNHMEKSPMEAEV